MRGRVFAFLIALSLIAATTAAAASSASRSLPGTPVPPRFVGMDVTDPVFTSKVPGDDQLSTMVASGVETIRVAFSWAGAQPYKDWLSVPGDQVGNFQSGVKGVPTDFSQTDQVVEVAAKHGVTVLPTVLYAPRWDAAPNKHGFQTPKHTQGYANYLTTLIDRYGPNGVFWAHNPDVPKLPIRMWQIWNEENLPAYWPRPFVKKYVELLKASHKAIKAADPGAKVVLGALTDYSWLDLGKVEKVAGARQSFDYIAINNFTATVDHAMLIMRLVRRRRRPGRRFEQADARDGAELALGEGEERPALRLGRDRGGSGETDLSAAAGARCRARAAQARRVLLLQLDGRRVPQRARLQLRRPAQARQAERQDPGQAGPRRVQARCARTRALPQEGRRRHPLHPLSRGRRPADPTRTPAPALPPPPGATPR